MSSENQRVRLTKLLLREAILRILQKKTIDQIGVTEICKEAGINRATFYRHYQVPGDILREMEHEIVQEIASFSWGIGTLSEAEEYIVKLCTYVKEHSDIFKILIQNYSGKDFERVINEFYYKMLSFQSEVTGYEDIDEDSIKLIVAYLAGGGLQMFRLWILDDIQKTPKEITNMIISLVKRPMPLM